MAKYKICVDPGHGGKDPGATNGNVYEKNINLQIGLKLKDKLEATGLYEVYMTRTNDVYEDPYTKAQEANKFGADYFISIHCNSAAMSSANGVETLAYLGSTSSTNLAKAVQTELVAATQLRDRGVKFNNNLTVLNSTSMPAILVETAFINNPKEVINLQSTDFQNSVAAAIVKGLNVYLGVTPVTQSKPVVTAPKEEVKVEIKEEANHKSDFEEARLSMMALGISDGTNPKDPVTREQVWAMLNRLINKFKLDK